MVEFADFNHGPREPPMTDTSMPLIELLQKQDDGDFGLPPWEWRVC